MNCKPGELCMIVHDDVSPQNVGRLVTTIQVFPRPVPGWECVGPIWTVAPCGTLVSLTIDYDSGEVLEPPDATKDECEHPDAWLKPIRDPGDDATDETLLWIGSPTKEAA